MDEIDILLATYNGKKYIRELLDSLCNQTYKNIRILVCDDCSNDDTVSIIRKYMEQDSRIILFQNKENIGSNKTFEYLLKKVESKYFMFADQDDVWNIDKVELTYNKLISEKADLVFTDLEVVDENLNTINKSFNKLKKYNYIINKCIKNGYDLEILHNTITGCTILSKKKWIKEILLIPENKNILYDYWLGLIVALKGKIVYLDKPTIKYRQHINNQVGTLRYVERFNDFNSIRNHLISIRIDNFTTFINNKEIFNDEQNKLNENALKYYKCIENKKNINMKNIGTFHRLYKKERLSFYISMFFIFNIPIIVRILYKIKN